MSAGSADGLLQEDAPEEELIGKPIIYARGEDWEGLYVGGTVMTQNHWLHASDVIDILKEAGYNVCEAEVDDDWLMDAGYLPADIRDVKWNSTT